LAAKTKAAPDAESVDLDMRLIRALGHPYRYRALHILNKRVASPNEIANEIGVAINKLGYHIRELEKLDCIELVKTEQRRGATEHFYRAIRRADFSDEEWVHIPSSLKDDLVVAHMQAIGKEIGASLADGTFNARDDRWQCWMPMQVDEEGWKDAMAALEEAEEKLVAIQADSANRLAKSGEGSVQMAVSLMGFETAAKSR
jgi:predicted ArsR family transcriptional regulator